LHSTCVLKTCQNCDLLIAFTVCTTLAASAGAAAGGIIYFVSYLPFTFFGGDTQYADLSANDKFGISLVPTLAMAIGCKNLAQFESLGTLRFYLYIGVSYMYILHRHTQKLISKQKFNTIPIYLIFSKLRVGNTAMFMGGDPGVS